MGDKKLQKVNEDDNGGLFERIRHGDERSGYYWSARELQKVLGYSSWQKFVELIKKAKKSFEASGANEYYDINDHFNQVVKMVGIGSNAGRGVDDYELTQYACYLIAQNGDANKKSIALAQAYFNIQTLRQERLENMSDEERRLYVRRQVTDENKQLFEVAKKSGVRNYGEFNDAGYLGLYGMRNKEIVEKKGLGKDKLLDRAGSTELAANLFRITQTKDKLENEVDDGRMIGDEAAAGTHFDVGRKVRKTIEEIGGTMPENLPPEEEHIKKLEKRMGEARRAFGSGALEGLGGG